LAFRPKGTATRKAQALSGMQEIAQDTEKRKFRLFNPHITKNDRNRYELLMCNTGDYLYLQM
jgi:hypothetical protein